MEAMALKDDRLHSLIQLYDWQTDFFKSVLDGISDDDAHKRLNTKANHVAWLAGSLVQQRFELTHFFTDERLEQQAHELFKDNQGIKESVTYPSLEQYKKEWDKITSIAREYLVAADKQRLDTIVEIPGMPMPIYELIIFSIYREANHIGQIALWRRLLGYDPMKYM